METLIQGDNKPIILEMDEPVSNITQFSAVLYGNGGEFKRWNENSALFDNTTITLPLTQEDTLALKERYANLEIKFLTESGIEFLSVITFLIVARKDATVFDVEV